MNNTSNGSEPTKSESKPLPALTKFELTQKGKIIVTEKLQKQIDYLHKKVGGTEWCGFLFYEVIEGSLQELDKLVIRADDIFPMDIGTSAHTAATIQGEDLLQMYEKIPGAEGKRYGLIHTHHNMTSFFSGTDDDELHTNVRAHGYYVSLVVNFSGVYVAKLAYLASVQQIFKFLDIDNAEASSTFTRQVSAVADLLVVREVVEPEAPDYVVSRFQEVDEKRKKTVYPNSWSPGQSSGVHGSGISVYPGSGGGSTSAYRGTTAGFRPNNDKDKDQRDWGEKDFAISERTGSKHWNEQEDVEEASAGGKTGKEKPLTIVTSSGTRTVTMSESDAREVVIEWFAQGIPLTEGIRIGPRGKFNTITEALHFFDAIFLVGRSTQLTSEYNKFLDWMSTKLVEVTASFLPSLVERRVGAILKSYDHVPIAKDLLDLVNAHSLYVNEIRKGNIKQPII